MKEHMRNLFLRQLSAWSLSILVLASGCTSQEKQQQNQAQSTEAQSLASPTPTPTPNSMLNVFYAQPDGIHLGRWPVALGTAHDLESVAYVAVATALAGPPLDVRAIRFPKGTKLRSLHVVDGTATLDLSPEIRATPAGGFAEAGEFKALVWTLTDIPGIQHVRIKIAGAVVPTLPGGHFELDEPLSRADW